MTVPRKKIEKQPDSSMTQGAAERAAAEAEAASADAQASKRSRPSRKQATPPPVAETPKRIHREPVSTRIDTELVDLMNAHWAQTRISKQTMIEEGVRLFLQQAGYDA